MCRNTKLGHLFPFQEFRMKRLFFPLALTAALLLAGTASAATIKIGLMAPITGAFASEGQDMKKIVELMAENLNSAGGINGDKVEIIVEDDGSAPRSAATAASRLVAAGVPAAIGTYGSAVTKPPRTSTTKRAWCRSAPAPPLSASRPKA